MSARRGDTHPDRDRLAAIATTAIAIPVVRVLEFDGLDPLAAFALLAADEPHAALLETSEAASGDADFSVVVPRAREVLVGPDALDRARPLLHDRVADVGVDLPRFVGGVVGMLAHEFVTTLEPRVERATGPAAIEVPDATLLVVDELVAFDHRAGRVLAITTISFDDAPSAGQLAQAHDAALGRLDRIEDRLRDDPPVVARTPLVAEEPIDPFAEVRTNLGAERYERLVADAREQVLAGECVQVVVSQRFDRDFDADPLLAYRAVRAVAPAPYHALLRLGDVTIVGASPEQLVGVPGDERIVTHPIAGTRPRGSTVEQDLALEHELLADRKERAEHMMLVDLGRNDVARASIPGSVEVVRTCEVERYSHVMHLVSRVEGDLRPGLHPIDALLAAYPAGTLTGAPKVRAMELIAQLEPDRRGAYGGVVGYAGHGRTLDMAITIRTAVLAGGIASVQAGAGIVAGSDPAAEEAETRHKARSVLSALAVAERAADRAAAASHGDGAVVGGAA